MLMLQFKFKTPFLNKIKTITSLLLLSFCMANLSCTYAATEKPSNPTQQQQLDKIVAVVNDDVITNAELTKKINLLKAQIQAKGGAQLPSDDELKKQILNNMVLEILQLQIAKLNNIYAMPDQINMALNSILKQSNMTEAQFQKKLEHSGVKFEDFKADLEKQLTMMNTQRAIAQGEIKISNQELNQEIIRLNKSNIKNSYRVSHILVAVPNEPTSESIILAKQKAEKISQELKNGKDFAATAMIASDSSEALQGGDLGWYNSAELPSLFSEIVPRLNKNEVYGPIQSEDGFHIIKLTEVKHDSSKFQEIQYKVKHILIKNDAITSNIIAKQELEKLKKEILEKNNFSDLALIYSEDVASASKGGDLGWISSRNVVPEFARVIESLTPNSISEPFKTQYGWHIAKLEAIKKVDNTLDWQKTQAKQILENRKFQDALVTWQNKIKSESHIKILI